MNEKTSVLVVASPSPTTGGGGSRALRSLRRYVRHFNTFLFIPWGLWANESVLRDSISYLRDLREIGVRFAGFSRIPKILYE